MNQKEIAAKIQKQINSAEVAKYTAKDTVFTDLFQDTKYDDIV